MIDAVTPYDIDTMEVDEVLKYINDRVTGLPDKKARLNLIKVLYKLLGYDLSPDAALAMTAEPNKQLIIATAGAGKTTQSQLKIVVEKVIRKQLLGRELFGNRVLCLVYNDHNVKPMKAAHKKMVNRLYNSGIEGLTIDGDISAYTLHSFCEKWKDEYAIQTGLYNCKLLSEQTASLEIMRSAFVPVAKKHGLQNFGANYNGLFKMYNYAKECLMEFDSRELAEKFAGEVSGVPPEAVKDLFVMYEALKKTKKRYDFIDQPYKMYELLKNNEIALKHVRSYYDYVVADEIQDFTPLMMKLLQLIAGDLPVLAIGDEDQTLYEFKGADVQNALSFSTIFPEGEVYVLNTNRRCRKKIGELAVHIITENENRFNKKILFNKEGGKVDLIPYNTEEGQLISIVKRMEAMSIEERTQTVIGYRNGIHSCQITEMLEERGIAFNVLSGFMPFNHELYRHVMEVMDALFDPRDPNSHLKLYKVLSPSSSDLYNVLGWDADKRKYKKDPGRTHFNDLDWGIFEERTKFRDDLAILTDISTKVGKEPMNSYFPQIFDMICKYFWNFKKEQYSKNLVFDNLYTERVRSFFTTNKTYDDAYKDLVRRSTVCENWDKSGAGVTLGTLHSLKGLEFKNVFMIFMDDAIFPNTDLSSRNSDEKEAKGLKEAETRTCYVGMTRAEDYLGICYPSRNPSYFVKRMLKFYELAPDELIVLDEQEDMDMTALLGAADAPRISSTSPNSKSFLSSAFNHLKI
jgi:DNA helicase-2/ATP-dependent DNA helicase PcrA